VPAFRLGLVADLLEPLIVQRVLDEDDHCDGKGRQQTDGGANREDRAGGLNRTRVSGVRTNPSSKSDRGLEDVDLGEQLVTERAEGHADTPIALDVG
jgi:hypothetical protein